MQILVQQVCGGARESQILPMLLFPQTQVEMQGLNHSFMRTAIQFIVEVSSDFFSHFYIKKSHRYTVARAK